MFFGPTLNTTSIEVLSIVPKMTKEEMPWPLERSKFFLSEYRGDGTVGAVLDSGTGRHYEIEKNLIKRLTPNGKTRRVKSSKWFDHATFVSGEVHSEEDGKGIVGAAPKSKFYDIQALSDKRISDPFGYLSDAIELAISLDVDAVNMSLGSTHDDNRVRRSIKRAYDKGIILVAAAGNRGRSGKITPNYPSDYPEVISVGSVNSKDLPSDYTQYSKSVFLCIGGEQVYGILPDNLFGIMSGTSMASPLIYAVALRWCEKHPEVKKEKRPESFMEELKSVVVDIHTPGYDNRTGHGYLIDVPQIAMYKEENSGPNFFLVV